MTLVLSIATPEFAVQVSDRRLTFVDRAGEVRILDDDANKQTVFCNRMVFAYTGLAHVGNLKTDVWLSHVLAEGSNESLSEAINRVRDKASTAFLYINLPPSIKRHAFIGVGWTRSSPTAPILPIMCRISNYHDHKGCAMSNARSDFQSSYRIYKPPTYWGWLETGANMSTREVERLHRLMSRCANKITGPGPVVRLFVATIRSVAAREATVGCNLLSVVVPRSAAMQESTMMISPSGWGVVSGSGFPENLANQGRIDSIYFPGGTYKGVEYSPNFACKGFSMTGIIKTEI